MVDFDKLRSKKLKPKPIDPLEVFRRLPKPPGINDLYTSQSQVLKDWYERRSQRDLALKLHTGGGKTLVGLLIGQSSLNETGSPVLYLAPTVQLVKQALEKASDYGIAAVPYKKGEPLDDDFTNSRAIMVATYKALFNGKSKFGLRGTVDITRLGTIILDDAHAAFSVVRESFTLAVDAEKQQDLYRTLSGMFRGAFKEIERVGTFDDTIAGSEYGVLEVPYWAWHQRIDAVREQLKGSASDFALVWPLLRDRLHLCHALISQHSFTITPILPLVDALPAFADAGRRIYMSATIADDSDIIRTYDADAEQIGKPMSSRSLAGISERMVLIPDLMPFKLDVHEAIAKLAKWTSKKELGTVILVPSDKAASGWEAVGTVAIGSAEVEQAVQDLQSGATFGPVIFANRYDGIDLPGDACRLLVMYGLPRGISDYEMFRADALFGGSTITRMLAQRIEQGIGRGGRGAGDYCVVLLAGPGLAGWIAKDSHFRFLTSATRAQLEMGTEVSKEIGGLKDLSDTIARSFGRDTAWVEYHAETLAELVDDDLIDDSRLTLATTERKALNLWRDGYAEKAIAKIDSFIAKSDDLDPEMRGWMQQLAARIADHWGNDARAQDLQRQAFANNRNLIRPKVLPPYQPLSVPGQQAQAIAKQIGGYRLRLGFLQSFEDIAARLVEGSSSGQFEDALAGLGTVLGLSAERHDRQGVGPDVLWLLPGKMGLVIEAKSRKQEKNALSKENHGQLLVAEEWFKTNYPDHQCVRVSVHPKNRATKAAAAGASRALTYEMLAMLVSEARALFSVLCQSQLPERALVQRCHTLLEASKLRADRLVNGYLQPFSE